MCDHHFWYCTIKFLVLKPVTLYCQCSFVCWVYDIMMIRLYISCIKHTINRAHNTLVAYYNSITTMEPVSGDMMLMESGMLLAFINQTNITTLMRWELLWENQIRWNLDCLILSSDKYKWKHHWPEQFCNVFYTKKS